MQQQIKTKKTSMIDDLTNKSENYISSYMAVNKNLLNHGDCLEFNLYLETRPTVMTLFLQSNTVLDKIKKQKLESIENLFTNKYEESKYEQFVDIKLQDFIQDDSKTIDEKTEVIYTSNKEIVKSLYNNPDALENAERSKKIIEPILSSVINNEDIISSYIKIINYDYLTYTHSLNVSIYALCLGANLNLSKQDLQKLGQAALLHDIGKSKISKDIINKNGTLTANEFETIKKHSLYSYNMVVKMGITDVDILNGIRHHHEKLNGMGYPDGLSDKRITLFPRIIAICDVFDAITTKRTYKDALKSFEALFVMKKEMKDHLDSEILNVFIKMLSR